jgi:hypothetical protein
LKGNTTHIRHKPTPSRKRQQSFAITALYRRGAKDLFGERREQDRDADRRDADRCKVLGSDAGKRGRQASDHDADDRRDQ